MGKVKKVFAWFSRSISHLLMVNIMRSSAVGGAPIMSMAWAAGGTPTGATETIALPIKVGDDFGVASSNAAEGS
jgi:hypothetical protein